MSGRIDVPLMCLLTLLTAGCGSKPSPPPDESAASDETMTQTQEAEKSPATSGYGDYYGGYYGAGPITFADDVATNVSVGDEITRLTFTDIDGKETALSDYIGKKAVVLVITRGNTNPICPYCTTQTSRLIANYPKFADRNAEVLVVYPIEHSGDQSRLTAFIDASRKLLENPNQPVPFPILLDVELKAVDRLGIRKDLSKPATYIIDPEGHVRFAYVGADINDRPSIDAMLKQLDADGTSPVTATNGRPAANP
ncbi:MAG: peroxiredoxin family protein [Planctomycetaceae bacterium]|nr:peroxiredoxin family protein [Planctomycetaceae bacterium]